MHRRTSWTIVSILVALVAIAAIAATAAVPPNLTRTIEAQRRLAAERPQDAAVFNDLGNLLLMVPQPAEAEAAYRKAVEIDPDKVSALFNLGLLLQQRGELREANGFYRRVVKLEPGHAWAHYQIGSLYEVWGQQSRAIESYAKAFSLDPQLAFPEINPHIVENKLVTAAMLRAYKDGGAQPQAPRIYDEPSRIAGMLVPPPAPPQSETDQNAANAQQQQQGAAGRQPATTARTPAQGATVLRERDLDRSNPSGQAQQGRGGNYPPRTSPQPRSLREWNRPEPTYQEIPQEGVTPDQVDEGVQPEPVVTPPPGGVYYRPGVQSTGRLNLQVVPERSRTGRG
ncbi:MAG TPA: tetratricopeptide repeat protein [Thermoanaerobaculia bacterium]